MILLVSDYATKAVRKRKTSENDSASSKLRSHYSIKEDLENKQSKKKNCCRGSSKKKVLEEANNSKLREVQVRVENCLQNGSLPAALSALCRRSFEESAPKKEEEVVKEEPGEEAKGADCENDDSALDDTSNSSSVQLVPVEVQNVDGDDQVRDKVPVPPAVVSEAHSEEDDCVIVAQRTTTIKTEERECSSRGDDDGPLSSSSPFSRMELIESANSSLLRFPDDRSDSGVSSLRSGSGDERSGSRSSALSSSDEPPQHNCSSQSQSTSNNRSPLFIPAAGHSTSSSSAPSEPVRVWRDPSLLLESEPHVRHIHSVQHQSLLMSHPSTPASAGPPSTSAASHPAAALYPPVPPPPTLMGPHPLQHHPHLAPPPGLYPHLELWKQRYPLTVNPAHLLPQGTHAAAEEMLERERAIAQDRDRHERLLR